MGYDNIRDVMIYQHAVKGADRSRRISGIDDEGSAGILVPAGQSHINCTEDRKGSKNDQGPGPEIISDLGLLCWSG
ncbi:hypothetical protein Aph01nite_64750 [Acrocarpospora phusangensis]|uniref:Uncharacterized protein n=1 Tax=Acrocarpospora phusangensis TaxID=1070424 RepID=A0A919QKV3_9ACTN|nr:hypothetical protein Aph01nite_64750 [Acrocarpospora phusangensis]